MTTSATSSATLAPDRSVLHRASSGVSTRPRPSTSTDPRTIAQHPVTPRTRVGQWRGWTVLVAAAAMLAVGVVHARGMYTAPIRFDDEGTYAAQAHTLLTQGPLAPYTYWYDHPPLGWMVLAGWMGTLGALWDAPNLIGSGRQLMLVLDVLSVALVVLLARRTGLARWVAGSAGLLYGLSPLALTYHRMLLLDNIATPLLLGALILAMSPTRRLCAALGSGMLLASAVLVKETVLLMLPFVLWALWRSFTGTTRRMCVTVFGLGLVLPALLYPLFAVTKGELTPGPGHVSLWQGVFFQLLGRQSSGSVLQAGSDAHAVVAGWLSIDPYLIAAASALVVPALLIARLRPIAAALLFAGVAILRPGYLPVPYIVALVPFAALVVAGVPGALTAALLRRLREPVSRSAWSLATRTASGVALAGLVTGLVIGVQDVRPHWYYGDVSLMHTNFDRPYLDSTAWLQANVPKNATLLVDNVTWTSLLSAGYPQQNLIWFTKPNADQQVDRRVPNWQAITYVVSSDIIRTSRQNGGTVKDALLHSRPVARWGSGSHEIEIRKVGP